MYIITNHCYNANYLRIGHIGCKIADVQQHRIVCLMLICSRHRSFSFWGTSRLIYSGKHAGKLIFFTSIAFGTVNFFCIICLPYIMGV